MADTRDFIISTDTSADLPFSYLDENHIGLLSLGYTMEGQTYFGDDRTIDQHEFYERMRSGSLPITMQVTPENAKETFGKLVDEGNDVLHIAFSSGLSGSYNSAEMGAQEVREAHPDAKVIVIDSLCASLGQGLMINYAVQMKKEGKSIDEIAAWIEERKQNFIHHITVEDLNHLFRGGRVSKTTAVVGTMLGIKPIIHVNSEGKLLTSGKVRGRKQSLMDLINGMGPKMEGFVNDTVFIAHGDCLEDAKFCAEEIKKKYKIKNFLFNFVGPVIGAHSGPGTIVICFFGKDRTETK